MKKILKITSFLLTLLLLFSTCITFAEPSSKAPEKTDAQVTEKAAEKPTEKTEAAKPAEEKTAEEKTSEKAAEETTSEEFSIGLLPIKPNDKDTENTTEKTTEKQTESFSYSGGSGSGAAEAPASAPVQEQPFININLFTDIGVVELKVTNTKTKKDSTVKLYFDQSNGYSGYADIEPGTYKIASLTSKKESKWKFTYAEDTFTVKDKTDTISIHIDKATNTERTFGGFIKNNFLTLFLILAACIGYVIYKKKNTFEAA